MKNIESRNVSLMSLISHLGFTLPALFSYLVPNLLYSYNFLLGFALKCREIFKTNQKYLRSTLESPSTWSIN